MGYKYAKKFIPLRKGEVVSKGCEIVHLSKKGKERLKWIKYYKSHEENASLVSRYYGISRKTFYKWYGRYKLLGLKGLEDMSKAPINKRGPEITWEEELRIKKLRKQYIRYGKEKLSVLYKKIYGEKISGWKIYQVIRKYNLYWSPVKNEKLRKKRKLAEKKKRITELKNKQLAGFFFQVDTKVIWCYPTKRYIFTAVDKNTKIGFARMYKNNSSYSGRDFLLRLYYLLNNNLPYIQSDNGSEFNKYFEEAYKELEIEHYFSRVRAPKDNAEIERFNRTLEEEFLQMGNYIDDLSIFNGLLTDWLVEYNFNRPHRSLDMLTPMEFIEMKKQQNLNKKVLLIY
ncbi:MAG TPA: integrase core domain-containing protein [Candidatus Ratteibacteria bacterium]|nr:integrase core domain-containing protein [Candidatus Ratteibacteria bacterium]